MEFISSVRNCASGVACVNCGLTGWVHHYYMPISVAPNLAPTVIALLEPSDAKFEHSQPFSMGRVDEMDGKCGCNMAEQRMRLTLCRNCIYTLPVKDCVECKRPTCPLFERGSLPASTKTCVACRQSNDQCRQDEYKAYVANPETLVAKIRGHAQARFWKTVRAPTDAEWPALFQRIQRFVLEEKLVLPDSGNADVNAGNSADDADSANDVKADLKADEKNAPASGSRPKKRKEGHVFHIPVAKKARNAAGSESPDSNAADSKAADSKAADSNAADPKAADSKAADSKAADSKAADSKAADSKAADSKAIDQEQGDRPASTGLTALVELLQGTHASLPESLCAHFLLLPSHVDQLLQLFKSVKPPAHMEYDHWSACKNVLSRHALLLEESEGLADACRPNQWTRFRVWAFNEMLSYWTDDATYDVKCPAPRSRAQCTICLEAVWTDHPSLGCTVCGHWMHANCASDWFSTKPSCPTCRRPSYLLVSHNPRSCLSREYALRKLVLK
jgi:hypothetical protein